MILTLCKYFLLFALLLSFQALAVQPNANVSVKDLYIEVGRDTDLTYKVLTDDQGFLWSATDNGLKRYDGYQIITYIFDENDPTSIGSSTIEALIYTDSELWIGGANLNKYEYDSNSFTRYDASDGHVIWTIFKHNNIMWVGGDGFGLRGFDIKTMALKYQYLNKDNERFVYSIKEDKDSNYLLIASREGLYHLNSTTGEIEKYLNSIDIGDNNQTIEEFVIDKNNNIWLATRQGLYFFDRKTRITKNYSHQLADPNSLLTNVHWTIFEDRDGDIWIGTDKYGVSVYQPATDSFINIHSSLTSDQPERFPPVAIYDIYQDQQGSFWFATGEGIRRISPQLERFKTLENIIGNKNSLAFNNVLTLYQDKAGIIWIATDGGGLDRYDSKSENFQHFTHDKNDPFSLSSDSVISINEDSQGNLWIGTYNGGFNKFDRTSQRFTHYQHDNSKARGETLDNNDIFKIYIDEQDRIWLSVWRAGLQIFNPKDNSYTSYFSTSEYGEHGISNFSIVDIEPRGNGKYWLGGYSGLESFDINANQFNRKPISNLETVNDIFSVNADIIWIGSSTGLYKYNDATQEVILYTVDDGLADNNVISIIPDDTGKLWLTTRSGINLFDPNNNKFIRYTTTEGLVSNLFNRYSQLKADDGRIYVGGPNGINIFNPEFMPNNGHIPNVVITHFDLYNNNIESDDQYHVHFSLNEKAVLTHDQNDVLFEFTALDFIAPSKNKYSYRLVGLENEWNEVSANGRKVRYTNLSFGNYTFELKASNNEGLWNETGTRVNFTILPPWWHTWWAYLLYLIMLIACVYLIIYWRMAVNRRQAHELEKQVRLRTTQLNTSNKELEQAIVNLSETQKQLVESEKMASLGGMVAGISHEVNTPLGICLTSISHMKEQSKKLFDKFEKKTLKENDFKQFKNDIDIGLNLSLSNIVRAADLIRSFKQVAVDQSAEQMHTFYLHQIISDTIKTVSPKLNKRHTEVIVNCSKDIQMMSYPGAISQIIINFVINSLTHGIPENQIGLINIDVENNDKEAQLTYRDNGIGIKADQKSKVFEPFYTTNRKEGNTGLGMHIVYNLVSQQLGGSIVLNIPEKGVEFVITIPLITKNKIT